MIERKSKHLCSIWQKMIKKNRSFDEVFDLIALGIVTGDEVNCYKILERFTLFGHQCLVDSKTT